MEINTKTKKDHVVLNLHGDIDSYNSSVLKSIITSQIDQNELNITLNMADVDHIDSEAIDVLLLCSKNIKQLNGSLKIKSPNEAMLKNKKLIKSLHII